MKVLSAALLTLLCYFSISCKKIKTTTKNFDQTCGEYNLVESNTLSATCQMMDESWQSTKIDVTDIANLSSEKGYLYNKCIPRKVNLENFVVEYFCNMKGKKGKIKKYTAELALTDLVENIDGELVVTKNMNYNLFRNVVDTEEGEDLF
jgi:hypothetical protein